MKTPHTVGPIHLTHLTPVPLWGRMEGPSLVSLWSYDEHTGNRTDYHQGFNITPDDWTDARDRFRLQERLHLASA